ncbi:MAG: Fic family protein [Chthoniobacteraceae bacterium]
MFRFLDRSEVDELHRESLNAFGGAAGTRDDGLVESALCSAINTTLYGGGDAFDVAAAYAFHIAQAQAFIDGNKRTAIGAALTFLALNHPMRNPAPADIDTIYDAMIAIANHELDKPGLAALLRRMFA